MCGIKNKTNSQNPQGHFCPDLNEDKKFLSTPTELNTRVSIAGASETRRTKTPPPAGALEFPLIEGRIQSVPQTRFAFTSKLSKSF